MAKRMPTLDPKSHGARYSNCKIYHPSGKLMCVNSQKKGQWYVEKTNAEVLERDELGGLAAIKLTFEPRGFGFEEDDVFGLSVQETRCVITGIDDISQLTRHHIVPSCYRKHFPIEFKSRNHHDVVFITEIEHDKYERYADMLKIELAGEYGIETASEAQTNFTDRLNGLEMKKMGKIRGYLNTFEKNSNKLPASRIKEFKVEIFDYVKSTYDIELKELTDYWSTRILEDIETEFQRITKIYNVDTFELLSLKLADEGLIDNFIKRWRHHFIDTMKPKYLPKGWSVDYRTSVNIID